MVRMLPSRYNCYVQKTLCRMNVVLLRTNVLAEQLLASLFAGSARDRGWRTPRAALGMRQWEGLQFRHFFALGKYPDLPLPTIIFEFANCSCNTYNKELSGNVTFALITVFAG